MFYVKTKLGRSDLITKIHDYNVFSKCLKCGKEICIDISDVFRDGEGNLYNTKIVCRECGKTVKEKREVKRHG